MCRVCVYFCDMINKTYFLTWQASIISLSKRYCSMVERSSVLPYLTRNFSFNFSVVAGEFPGVLRKLSSSVSEKVGECERLLTRLLRVLVTDRSSPTTRRLFASDGESSRLLPPKGFSLLKLILIEIMYPLCWKWIPLKTKLLRYCYFS